MCRRPPPQQHPHWTASLFNSPHGRYLFYAGCVCSQPWYDHCPIGLVGRTLVAFSRIYQSNFGVRYKTNYKTKSRYTTNHTIQYLDIRQTTGPTFSPTTTRPILATNPQPMHEFATNHKTNTSKTILRPNWDPYDHSHDVSYHGQWHNQHTWLTAVINPMTNNWSIIFFTSYVMELITYCFLLL